MLVHRYAFDPGLYFPSFPTAPNNG